MLRYYTMGPAGLNKVTVPENEVLEIFMETEKLFHSLPSIAWDIAISERGPMIIEINSITQIARNQFWPGFEFTPEYFLN